MNHLKARKEYRRQLNMAILKAAHFCLSFLLFFFFWLLFRYGRLVFMGYGYRYNYFVTALYAFLLFFFNRSYNSYLFVYSRIRALVFALGISLGVCALPFRFSGKRGGQARLRLVCGDRSVELTALRDTGNRLREPLSGAPALIAEERALLPLLEPELRSRLTATAGLPAPERLMVLGPGFRLLPYRTLGENGLLLAFRPERVYVDGTLCPDIWAALCPGPLRPGDGCAALLGGDE